MVGSIFMPPALKVFIASLGLLGSFLGLPVGFLINGITY